MILNASYSIFILSRVNLLRLSCNYNRQQSIEYKHNYRKFRQYNHKNLTLASQNNMLQKYAILLLFFAIPHSRAEDPQKCQLSIGDSELSSIEECPVFHSCLNGFCVRKDIFPLTLREIIGGLIIMVLIRFSNTGSVRGGSILSPILLFVFKYRPNKTIIVIYVLIFGGSLGSFLNVFFLRDQERGNPLMIYDLALIIVPAMLIGSNIGVLLNSMVPPIITLIALISVIFILLKRIFNLAQLKNNQRDDIVSLPILIDIPSQALLSEAEKTDIGLSGTTSGDIQKKENDKVNSVKYLDLNPETTSAAYPPELQEILSEDKLLFPVRKMIILLFLPSFLVIIMILRGSSRFDSIIDVEFCSKDYWTLYFFGILGCLLFFITGQKAVLRRFKVKRRYGYTNTTFNITSKDVNQLGLLGVTAGFVASLVGIGGGLILGSKLLHMGIRIQNMTATNGLIALMTSFISLFQAFMFGDITKSEILFFFLISFLGSGIMTFGLRRLIARLNKYHLRFVTMAIMLILAMIVMPSYAIYKAIEEPEKMIKFSSIC